jgi:hypothetical protein
MPISLRMRVIFSVGSVRCGVYGPTESCHAFIKFIFLDDDLVGGIVFARDLLGYLSGFADFRGYAGFEFGDQVSFFAFIRWAEIWTYPFAGRVNTQ